MNELNFNIYNIIILCGIIQGFIFSIVVLFNKKYKSTTNSFIVLTVLALTFSNFQYWIDDVNLKGLFSVFSNLRIPCDVLIVPSFCLFVNSYLKNKTSKKVFLLFALPFLISIFFNLILSYRLFFNNDVFRTINIILESFSFIFNLFLIIVIIYKIKHYENKNSTYEKEKVKSKTRWLKQILYIGSVMCLFWFATIIIMQTKLNTGLSIYYPLWISISLLVYWISYVSIFNSKIDKDRSKIRASIITNEIQFTEEKIAKNKSNDKLLNDILIYINQNKSYLNPDLNISLIANFFNISNGYLSQIFNANSNQNFNDYINNLRVHEVERMLKDKEYNSYTLIAIGLEAGFRSKSSFYTVFKKHTGKTPNEYKKIVQNN